MKSLVKFIAVLGLTAITAGWCYASNQADKRDLEVKHFTEIVRSGDTVDGILVNYHNEKNEGVDFREFKYNTLHLPENKHLLNENGYLKLIYPGDEIHIKAHVRVAR